MVTSTTKKTTLAQARALEVFNRNRYSHADVHTGVFKTLFDSGCLASVVDTGRFGYVLTQRGRNALPAPKGNGVIDRLVPNTRQVYLCNEREHWEMKFGDTFADPEPFNALPMDGGFVTIFPTGPPELILSPGLSSKSFTYQELAAVIRFLEKRTYMVGIATFAEKVMEILPHNPQAHLEPPPVLLDVLDLVLTTHREGHKIDQGARALERENLALKARIKALEAQIEDLSW